MWKYHKNQKTKGEKKILSSSYYDLDQKKCHKGWAVTDIVIIHASAVFLNAITLQIVYIQFFTQDNQTILKQHTIVYIMICPYNNVPVVTWPNKTAVTIWSLLLRFKLQWRNRGDQVKHCSLLSVSYTSYTGRRSSMYTRQMGHFLHFSQQVLGRKVMISINVALQTTFILTRELQ